MMEDRKTKSPLPVAGRDSGNRINLGRERGAWTIARLHGEHGYAVRVAVRRDDLPGLIPRIKQLGGTDLVVSNPAQIVP